MSAQPQAFENRWLDRVMTVDDLPAVLAIEQRAYQFPWSETVFRDCLRMNYSCRVAEDAQRNIRGYGLMSHAAGEGHILNLCVSPCQQRKGLGRFLLGRLIDIALQQRLSAVYLEVRPSNLAAIALYAADGFTQIGQRRNYYPAEQGREDAILLARMFN